MSSRVRVCGLLPLVNDVPPSRLQRLYLTLQLACNRVRYELREHVEWMTEKHRV